MCVSIHISLYIYIFYICIRVPIYIYVRIHICTYAIYITLEVHICTYQWIMCVHKFVGDRMLWAQHTAKQHNTLNKLQHTATQ